MHTQPQQQPAGVGVAAQNTAPQPVTAGSTVVGTTITDNSDTVSVADAARRAKQHQACLELAKDNPSVVCK